MLADLDVDRRTVVGVVRPPRDERDVDFDARWRAQRALPAAAGEPAPSAAGPTARRSASSRPSSASSPSGATSRSSCCHGPTSSGATSPSSACTNLLIPEGSVDGVSLVAAADFVLGAGGVMDREAVALGTPAYTLSRRPPSAVDAALLAGGRLKRAKKAADIALRKKDPRITAVGAPRPAGCSSTR